MYFLIFVSLLIYSYLVWFRFYYHVIFWVLKSYDLDILSLAQQIWHRKEK